MVTHVGAAAIIGRLPRKTEWTRRLPAAISALRALETPYLDRAAVERLLGLSPRQALRLMKSWNALSAGHSLLVSRLELIAALERQASGEAATQEAHRRARIEDELASVRRLRKAGTVAIAPAAAPSAGAGGLPEGVDLAPGRLQVTFGTVEDLLSKLLTLAQTVADDVDRFQALTAAPRRLDS